MLFRKKGVSTLVELMNRKDSEEPPEEGDWILFGEGEKNAEVENFKETWKLIINDGTLIRCLEEATESHGQIPVGFISSSQGYIK